MGNIMSEFKSLIEYEVEYGYGAYGYGWKITIKSKKGDRKNTIVYKSNLSEVRDILEGNLLRILNEMWDKS